VTENTIKKSLLHIFDKLGVSNRVELVLYALSRNERRDVQPEKSRAMQEGVPELKANESEFLLAIAGQ
jgi:hypothetical protein